MREEQLKDDYLLDLKINYSNVHPKGEVQVRLP